MSETVAKEYYDTSEIAEKFGVTEYTIRRWIKSGKIKAIKPGGSHWKIPHTEFVRIANEMYGEIQ